MKSLLRPLLLVLIACGLLVGTLMFKMSAPRKIAIINREIFRVPMSGNSFGLTGDDTVTLSMSSGEASWLSAEVVTDDGESPTARPNGNEDGAVMTQLEEVVTNEGQSSAALPYLNKEGRCHLGVVVYDNGNHLALHQNALRSLGKTKVGGVVTSEIKFPNNCSMDIVFSNKLSKFKHMDAVVFDIVQSANPGKGRVSLDTNTDQTFIYFAWEAPKASLFTTPVDAMWTYHRSSDILAPYGYYDKGTPTISEVKTPQQWVAGKTKMVLWISSHCHHTGWPRFNFVKTLRKYVPVDMYGKCGNLSCTPYLAPKCMSELLGQYKFYLSLESRECGDYITEKAWEKPLQFGTVPIVYGPSRQDYEGILPPHSFIHLSDFKSVKDLADYLKVLDANPDMYAKYLEWQYQGSVRIPRRIHKSFDPQMFSDVFTVMNKKKKGLLMKRRYLRDTAFAKSCRRPHNTRTTYGVNKWYPW